MFLKIGKDTINSEHITHIEESVTGSFSVKLVTDRSILISDPDIIEKLMEILKVEIISEQE